MGFRLGSTFSNTTLNGAGFTTTETSVCTTPPLTLPADNAIVVITGQVTMTWGTGTTGFNLRVRQGTTSAGTIVLNTGPIQATAAQIVVVNVSVFDPAPGAAGGIQYSLLIAAVGSTANNVPTSATLVAFVL